MDTCAEINSESQSSKTSTSTSILVYIKSIIIPLQERELHAAAPCTGPSKSLKLNKVAATAAGEILSSVDTLAALDKLNGWINSRKKLRGKLLDQAGLSDVANIDSYLKANEVKCGRLFIRFLYINNFYI